MKYKKLPQYVDMRTGCKVCWVYYKTLEEANIAAEIARYNGEIDRSYGYDFGYCSPGSVTLMKPENCKGEWAKYSGLYEVCIS